MIRHLILKELHDYLLSLRFQAGFALTFVLVSAAAFVLADVHDHDLAQFHQRRQQEDAFLGEYGHFNRLMAVIDVSRQPSPAVLVRGLPQAGRAETLDGDPMAEFFPPMDLTAIAGVVLSLLAIVLGFDAVNGEKERGTLRLVLANRVRRADVLLAKWLSGMLLLTVLLASALLAAAAVVQLQADVQWRWSDAVAGAADTVIIMLYCGVFFALSLCLSTLTRASAVSALAALFAWVLFVLVIPNLAPYVAAGIARTPSVAAIERDVRFITSEERDQIGKAEERNLRARYPTVQGLSQQELARRVRSEPELAHQYEQFHEEWEGVWARVNAMQSEKADRLLENWRRAVDRQFHLSRTLSYVSPFPPMLYASMALADTGFESSHALERQAQAYRTGLREYAQTRFAEARRANPTLGWNDFLDVSKRPRFTYAPVPLPERVETALAQAAWLLGWNALFFGLAVVGMLRFDVR